MKYLLQKKLSFTLVFLFSASLFAGGAFWAGDAEAHKGHAGATVTLVEKKVALKAMLPANGKVYRRKQKLSSDQIEWAKKTYGVDLSPKITPFYVSKDRSTKQQIGSAILYKFSYRHGNGEIAIGLDENNKITTAAFVSANRKYLIDFEETVGTGFFTSFDGMSVDDLVENAKKSESANKAARGFADAMRDAAVTLVAFQQK